MRDPGEFAAMRRGAILVTTATDPSWTPLFTLASGVIVEVGGMLSHASTIAREYGLSALANFEGCHAEAEDRRPRHARRVGRGRPAKQRLSSKGAGDVGVRRVAQYGGAKMSAPSALYSRSR
jgi:hypothetical protein